MLYRNILLITFFIFLSNCKTTTLNNNKLNKTIVSSFSNKGFALVYDEKYFDAGVISKKIDARSLLIFQRNLNVNTQVKITNILNNRSLIARVSKKSEYPLFNNSVLSKRIADELNLDFNEPYVEIKEIPNNSIFVAKKAKTYDEERTVAIKAPVNAISILDLNKIDAREKKKNKKTFLYQIKIADFYFLDTAEMMINRIINKTEYKKPKIKKIAENKYRVYLGPFNNISSLQKSYNDINILQFENIEFIRND